MIGRVVIENYKSVENLTLDLGRVTVLIGANGSGKSNILEAIALGSAATADKMDDEFLFSRGIRVSDDPRHMEPAFQTLEKNSPSEMTLGFYDTGDEEIISIRTFFNTSKGRWDAEGSIERRALEKASWPVLLQKSQPEAVEYVKSLAEGLLRDYEENGLLSFFVYAIENTILRQFAEEGQIQPLGIRGEGLFKLLTVLARDENRDRLNEIQERLQPLDWFGDFQIGGNVALGERTLRIRDQYLDGDLAYFTQRSANEGFLFLLFYFTLFVAKETPRFFAIDNIDASLNPKLCAELLRQLTELAEKYNKQVILTTHNPAILDGLNLRDDSQRLYVIERDEDGRTQARRVPAPRPPEKHEEPVPLSEAFLRGYIGGLPKNF